MKFKSKEAPEIESVQLFEDGKDVMNEYVITLENGVWNLKRKRHKCHVSKEYEDYE